MFKLRLGAWEISMRRITTFTASTSLAWWRISTWGETPSYISRIKPFLSGTPFNSSFMQLIQGWSAPTEEPVAHAHWHRAQLHAQPGGSPPRLVKVTSSFISGVGLAQLQCRATLPGEEEEGEEASGGREEEEKVGCLQDKKLSLSSWNTFDLDCLQ